MPSTDKTQDLGLNLWVGNDKPKRADLVADNLKIDAAFSDLAHYVTRIGVVDIVIPTAREYTINNENLLTYIAIHPDVELYFPDGNYNLNSSVTFATGVSLKLHRNATIIANTPMDFMFEFNNTNQNPGSPWTYKQHQYIQGGHLDGADKANIGVKANRFQDFIIKDITIKNVLRRGILSEEPAAELKLDNIYLYNRNFLTGAIDNVTDNIAIEIKSSDNYIHNITIIDFSGGIKIDNPGNYVDKVHFWTGQTSRVPYTVAFDVTVNGWAKFSYCVSDTAQIGFRNAQDCWLDHCQILNNSFYEPYFSGQPIGIYLVDGYAKIQLTACCFEDWQTTLGLKCFNIDVTTTKIKGKVWNTTYWGNCVNYPEDDYLTKNYSWTPDVYGSTTAGTITYTTRRGDYTRVGSMCHISMVIRCTLDNLISGDLRIKGLPYDSYMDTAVAIGYRTGFTGSNLVLGGAVRINTKEIHLWKVQDTGTSPVWSDGMRNTEIQLWLSATYLIK